jgi:hypothetical protein
MCQYWLGSTSFPGAAPRLGHRQPGSEWGEAAAAAPGRRLRTVLAGDPGGPPAGVVAERARPSGGGADGWSGASQPRGVPSAPSP